MDLGPILECQGERLMQVYGDTAAHTHAATASDARCGYAFICVIVVMIYCFSPLLIAQRRY